ncbi:MAG: hypothetical protein AABW59_04360 [archaeon]
MAYIPRKIVYPFFIGIFTIIFFSGVYLVSFYKPLTVSDAQISVEGDHMLLQLMVKNSSYHFVRGADILVKYGDEQITGSIGNGGALGPDENFEVVMELPFAQVNAYDVYVRAPYNRAERIFIPIDPSTLEPVKASVRITTNMIVGQKYDVVVELCNISPSDLSDVTWGQVAQGDYFDEKLFPRSIPIRSNECKPLYSTLTPNTPGKTIIEFTLTVGKLVQKFEQEVVITQE